MIGVPKDKRKVRLTWEFPTELEVFDEEKGEQPFVLGNTFTLSLFEQAPLRELIESWLGEPLTPQQLAEGYELENLLGKECQISVIHVPSKTDATKVYANIKGIMPCSKGMKVDPAINETVWIGMDDWETASYDALPAFVKKEIMESIEWKKAHGEDVAFGDESQEDASDEIEDVFGK